MVKALLIEWETHTGKRAGGINPKDPALRCNGWQNMDVTPALEIRLVEDNRDMSQYEGKSGVTILANRDAINAAIDANIKAKYSIDDELIYSEHVKSKLAKKEINIETLPNDRKDRLRELKSKGIKGIKEIKPQKV